MKRFNYKNYFEELRWDYYDKALREVHYERQPYNGDHGSNWLHIESDNNNGEGIYIEVSGYKEACSILSTMIMEHNLEHTGCV